MNHILHNKIVIKSIFSTYSLPTCILSRYNRQYISQSHFIRKNIAIDIILHEFRQRTPITRNDRFTIFHCFDGDKAESLPAAGHDDGIASSVVACEFFMRYPAEEGNAVGVPLLDVWTAADDVVADNGEVKVVTLTVIESLEENVQTFLGIESSYKNSRLNFPMGSLTAESIEPFSGEMPL